MIATEQDDMIAFHHVYDASEIVRELYDIRDDHTESVSREVTPVRSEETIEKDDKFSVLVETLGEVIVEYMKKKE
jgi:hypothetical protein